MSDQTTNRPPNPPGSRVYTVRQPGELLAWLFGNVPGLSRPEARAALRKGVVFVNGVRQSHASHPLVVGDEIAFASEGVAADKHPSLPFPILWEDTSVIAIDKPAGLLTIATDDERERTAHRFLSERSRHRSRQQDRIFVVHRLDRETSGVLIFAHNEPTKRMLQSNWSATEKEYLAIVDGVPPQPEGTLIHWLHEDTKTLRVQIVRKGGDAVEAVTHFTLLGTHNGRSLLRVRIDTGRKHQIRVQLAALGNPVSGDDRYGNKGSAPRLALHAHRLVFPHPHTEQRIEVVSPLPAVLASLVPQS